LRYSSYHASILNRAFFYFFINMLIVPGLAIPAGSSLYKIFITKIASAGEFLQNFYIIQRGDFFIILLLQQISFGFLGSLNQFGQLFPYAFIPGFFLRTHKKGADEQTFFKRESYTYDYGYNYALSLTILSIIFIFR
jgi:hypothetical protein